MQRVLFPLLIAFGGFAMLAQQTKPPAASSTQAAYDAQIQSVDKKFSHIVDNGSRDTPDQTPTVIQEGELNAWLQSGEAELPNGVEKLVLNADPGIINATATVDFDKVTEGARSSNPLLSLFRGTHEVKARAHARGAGGVGLVQIESVSIDGVGVPKMALEYFAEKYIKPKHPELGLDSRFQLPYKIDVAEVGSRQVTLTQK
jgi:hypothetical protein